MVTGMVSPRNAARIQQLHFCWSLLHLCMCRVYSIHAFEVVKNYVLLHSPFLAIVLFLPYRFTGDCGYSKIEYYIYIVN